MLVALVELCVLFAMIASPSIALADDGQTLDQARAPFDAGQYAEAHDRLSALLNPKLDPCDTAPAGAPCRVTSPEVQERARSFDAAALLALKRTKEADETIATILRQNPNFVPSPALFPQEVTDRFTFVRGSMAAELRKIVDEQARDAEAKRVAAQKVRDDQEQWISEIAKAASRETVVQTNSRWVALIPFGLGQFQNGDTAWGVTFAVTEVVAGATSLGVFAAAQSLASNQPAPSVFPAANARFETYATVNRISFATWAVVTVAGVVHAQLTFVPERVTYREKPVPPRPKLVPIATPLTRGAFVGAAGTF